MLKIYEAKMTLVSDTYDNPGLTTCPTVDSPLPYQCKIKQILISVADELLLEINDDNFDFSCL